MAINLAKITLDFLRSHSEEKYAAREIADWIFKNNPEVIAEKRSRSAAV